MSDDFDEAANPSNDTDFWLNASEPSLDAVWDNCEDDVYADQVHAGTRSFSL